MQIHTRYTPDIYQKYIRCTPDIRQTHTRYELFNLCEETISRTDEGQPRPNYIFNKCGTNRYPDIHQIFTRNTSYISDIH